MSITLKASFDGQEVLVTLRGHDFASVKAQVEEASAWLKAHAPAAAPVASQLSAAQHNAAAMHRKVTDFCPIHNVQMKENEKDGRRWFSHKVDGQWCKGK